MILASVTTMVLFLPLAMSQGVMQQWSSSQSSGPFSSSSFSSSGPMSQFASMGSMGGKPGPLLVRILVRRGSVSNLSQGNGQLSFYSDATGIHVMANGQKFDSNDVTGPYVVTNEDGPLVRREFTSDDELLEEKQRQAMRDSWNKMDDDFASNWNRMGMRPLPPLPGMQPMQPMQPFRMRSLF